MSLFFKSTECKTGPVWRVGNSERGEDIRKRCKKVNMVEIYVHMHACMKMEKGDLLKLFQEWEAGR
jgi:hypothetical protein